MGYCIELEYVKGMEFKCSDANNIINDIKEWAKTKRTIMWVDKRFIEVTDNIEDLFEELRYPLNYNKESDTYKIDYFSGEKLGDDDEIFKCISNYLTDGEICFLGDDGEYFIIKCQNGNVSIE